MPIHVMFGELADDVDPRSYVKRKLAGFFPESDAPTDPALTSLAVHVYSDGRPASPELVPESDFPKLSARRRRAIAARIDAFRARVDELSPLLEGEIIVEGGETCSYLAQDYRGHARNTPVLVRRTNRGVVYYLYDTARVEPDGKVSYHAEEENTDARMESHITCWLAENTETAGAVSAEVLLEQLAKGLVGLLPAPANKIGATLLNIILPGSSGLNYDQLLDDFAAIIRDANRRQTIAEQGGKLNGLVRYIDSNYLPQRDSGRSTKKALFELLNPQLSNLFEIAGVLQAPEFREGALSTFVSAATHKFAIYQEMALEDYQVKRPERSSKVVSIRKDAQADADYVDEVTAEMKTKFDRELNAWVKKISGVRYEPPSEFRFKFGYYFIDEHTGYHSGYYASKNCKDDPKKRCERARSAYINKVKRAYRKDRQDQLPWMRRVAENWRKLVDDPLPAPKHE